MGVEPRFPSQPPTTFGCAPLVSGFRMSGAGDQQMAKAQGPGDGLGGLEILGSFLAFHFGEFVKVVPKQALGERSSALILRAKSVCVAAKTFVESVKDFLGVMASKDVVRLVAACQLFHSTLLELPVGTWIRDGYVDGTYRKIFEESDGEPQKESYRGLDGQGGKNSLQAGGGVGLV